MESHPCCFGPLEGKLWAYGELPSVRQFSRESWDSARLPGGGDRANAVGVHGRGGRKTEVFITGASCDFKELGSVPSAADTPIALRSTGNPERPSGRLCLQTV